MSVVPPAGTHSYCTEGEYLLATPGSLYVIALACRGPTLLNPCLLQHECSFISLRHTPQRGGASLVIARQRASPFYVAPPTPQHRSKPLLVAPFLFVPLGIELHIIYIYCSRDSQHTPQPHTPKGNAYTTAVHWMARMARAEALREGRCGGSLVCCK